MYKFQIYNFSFNLIGIVLKMPFICLHKILINEKIYIKQKFKVLILFQDKNTKFDINVAI